MSLSFFAVLGGFFAFPFPVPLLQVGLEALFVAVREGGHELVQIQVVLVGQVVVQLGVGSLRSSGNSAAAPQIPFVFSNINLFNSWKYL